MASEEDSFFDEKEYKDWEPIFEREDATIKRKYEESGNLYRFYTRGIIKGVTPKRLFDVNMDLEYRTSWDANTSKLIAISDRTKDDQGYEVQYVYWVIKYPWPMSSRDYVCIRKSKALEDKQIYILVSNSTERDDYPASKTVGVRVDPFDSKFYMRPHGDGDVEFVSIYYEDPGGSIPKWLMNWAIKTAVPKALGDIRTTAIGYDDYLEKKKKGKK